MKNRANRPDDQDGQQGQPGSEDQFARGAGDAGARDIGADVEDEVLEVDDRVLEVEPADDDSPSILERDLTEQRDKYLRLAAEYDNFRKRTHRERLEAGARAQADLVRQLLDPLDDLERFTQVEPATTDAMTLVEGVQLVGRKLQKALNGAGLEIVDPVDQTFDPAVHEAVATEPALAPEDDNVIARVFQRGYVFKGQLLRPARVVVKQWNE